MPLNRDEVNELIKKLRERYKEYSLKHSPKWFDLNAFDERLSAAIKSRMNMEGFILAEISNFEKLKERYETKKKMKENTFTKEVDKILEENISRIKKYPQILFHSRCGIEISHLYGALSFLSTDLFPILRVVISDSRLKNSVNSLEDRLLFLAEPRGGLHARRIADHVLLLNRSGIRDIEIEKDSNDYLKESAFLLHDIIDFCDGIIDSGRDEWNYPVTFQKLFIEEERKKRVVDIFQDLTGYGAVFKIKEYASEIIEDFRLTAFKKNG
ncbi:MAG TPA: hypothetical protein PKG60_01455 [Spirochaetota bacterium]|nr:hypothetical protein [Spirochaetota bacterium]HPS85562.1 hypothetical protein [Spirochaetota bacterium]